MFPDVEASSSPFIDRAFRLLERVRYKTAIKPEDKEAIYRLRYDAYIREGAIEPNSSGMFRDPFDDTPNAWIVGMFIDGELASSIRLHVSCGANSPLPANTVFKDVLDDCLRPDSMVVEYTRFVARFDFSRKFSAMPYLTLRPGCMSTDHFEADYAIATIRSEHQAYYKRVFGHEVVCPARDYPTLKKKISCMVLDYPAAKERIQRRYPFYRSTPQERAELFAVSSNPHALAETKVKWDV